MRWTIVRRAVLWIARCKHDTPARAGAGQMSRLHRAGHAFLADGKSFGLELGTDAPHTVDLMRFLMDSSNLACAFEGRDRPLETGLPPVGSG